MSHVQMAINLAAEHIILTYWQSFKVTDFCCVIYAIISHFKHVYTLTWCNELAYYWQFYLVSS